MVIPRSLQIRYDGLQLLCSQNTVLHLQVAVRIEEATFRHACLVEVENPALKKL